MIVQADPAVSKSTVVEINGEKYRVETFFTPPHIARYAVARADVKARSVLEPSAGRGALALAAREAGARRVLCIENDQRDVMELCRLRFETWSDDFLTLHPFGQFERIVMSSPWHSGQLEKHIARALQWLAPDGKLVALVPVGFDATLIPGARMELLPMPKIQGHQGTVEASLLIVEN